MFGHESLCIIAGGSLAAVGDTATPCDNRTSLWHLKITIVLRVMLLQFNKTDLAKKEAQESMVTTVISRLGNRRWGENGSSTNSPSARIRLVFSSQWQFRDGVPISKEDEGHPLLLQIVLREG